MKEGFYCQGRWVDEEGLDWLRTWISEHWDWSRKRLARELCFLWGWRNERGRLKDFAARSYLLKLEGRGHIVLPILQAHKRRPARQVKPLSGWQEPGRLESDLSQLQPIGLERIKAGTEAAERWRFYLDRYHYLGLRVVGENVGYLAYERQGRELACVLFGAAAWRCKVRDNYLQWSLMDRTARLSRVANNTRFLILPWVKVPCLASHVLGQVVRRINTDWQAQYGHGLEWLETFVDTQRFSGTCYRAANWRYVGHTTGRSRQDRDHKVRVPAKAVYLYPLAR